MFNPQNGPVAHSEIAVLAEQYISSAMIGETLQRSIEWVDTDAAGHQHNSTIMRFVEATEAKLFRDAGITSYFAMAPRVRQEIDFSAKLYFGQLVTIALRVERLGSSSMTFGFKVWGHQHEGRTSVLAAEGKFVTVCVPPGEEASAPWPTEIRAAVESAHKL